MSTLYELTGEFLELLEMMEDEEVDQAMLEATLEGIDYEIEVKADGYARIIKQMECEMDGLEKELTRLSTRYKSYENRIKWIKDRLKNAMIVTGKTKFKTELFSFNVAKNGGKRKLVVDVPIEKLPENMRIKQPDKVDGDVLREYLERGFTYFDTAYVYHDHAGEKIVRKALVERHDRNGFELATKLPL